jgi:hypothetical protein
MTLDPGMMLLLGKAAGFAVLVRAWLVARRVAGEARAERAAKAAASREAGPPVAPLWRDAA